jgi:tRNA U34 5-methylaminomethyl-2-thiouridine-forming methyltransferase MnmC
MQRNLILTKDGSHTVVVPGMNVTYHSVHGAIQESMHVFIEAGFYRSACFEQPQQYQVLEMGFGTGLNALLTLLEAEKTKRSVHYTAIELYPMDIQQAHSLNYCDRLNRKDLQPVFNALHDCDWEKEISSTHYFTFKKTQASLIDFSSPQLFNLIYFDAFAPTAQPELWTKGIFEKLYAMMSDGGILVTYCSKADVRRAMQAAGFSTEKLPGPAGKREILRAKKSTV